MRGRDFLGGILLGAVIGTTLGLLLAPKSGEDTRADIRESAEEMSGRVRDDMQRLSNKIKDVTDQLSAQVTTAVKRVSTATAENAGAGEGEA